jgi:hypothetical protein
MASTARDTGKQATDDALHDEQTDPGYSDDAPVTLEELYEAVAELRGLVMVLAEPVIMRLQAKDAQQAINARPPPMPRTPSRARCSATSSS